MFLLTFHIHRAKEDFKDTLKRKKEDLKDSLKRKKDDFLQFVKSKKKLFKKLLKKDEDYFADTAVVEHNVGYTDYPIEPVHPPHEAVYSPIEAVHPPHEAVYSPIEAVHPQEVVHLDDEYEVVEPSYAQQSLDFIYTSLKWWF